MTLQRRRQRNADIFDTGPFDGYRGLGAEIDMPVDPGPQSNADAELQAKIESFNGGENPTSVEAYEGWTLNKHAGGTHPSTKYMFVILDPADKVRKVLLSSNWVAISAEAKKFIDDIEGTGFVPNAQSVAAGLVKDMSSDSAVIWSYHKGLVPYRDAYNTLYDNYGYSDNDINDIINYEMEGMVSQYELSRGEELSLNYNPTKPMPDYEAGTYLLPNVGTASAANTVVPEGDGVIEYWDGNLKGHTWGRYGCSTPLGAKNDGSYYPTPIVDAMGGYAVCLSHYIADYDNGTNEFLGFRRLTASELAGGIPAGIPMATVLQFFTKCAETRSGKDFDNFTWTGRNLFLDTEKEPIWRKAMHMPMKPKSFFFLEKELAIEDKVSEFKEFLVQNTQNITWAYRKSTSKTGYVSDTHDGKSVFYPSLGTKKVLDREFHKGKWGGLRTVSKTKETFGVKAEWLGEDGSFSEYSTHPPSIPDCNEEGKTVLIYRFPRQLDPKFDRNTLDFYAANNMPDYSITATKDCYPFPGGSVDKDKFGLIGRLIPGNSDDIGDEKFEAEYDGRTFAGRRSINLIPMISPNTPLEDYHRPYKVNEGETGVTGEGGFDTVDWFCFDVSDVEGATVSVTDPAKRAFFESGRITNSYFAQGDLKVGSTAFAVGQCMLTYEQSSPSVDERLSLVNLPPASERIILSTDPNNMTSSKMLFRSDEHTPRQPRDGSQGGKYTSDYLVPTATITTDDLVLGNEPIGMLAIKNTWKTVFGFELTADSFANMIVGGKSDRYGKRDPNNPLRYIVETTYGTFSFPYTIAGFAVPGHYKGPILQYSEEVDANDNYIPMGPTDEKPGLIGYRDVYLYYQNPFGTTVKATVSLDKQIQRQLDTVTLDEYGNPLVTYDEDGNPQTDVGREGGLFDQQTEEGGIDEGNIENVTQALQTEIQFEIWLRDRLMVDYGNVRFTDTIGKAYFKWWNEDYVTGKMYLEAGLPLPGVDLAPYYAEARAANIPITTELSETESQEAQSAAISGLGAFSDSKGFTVTDVTAKWGAIGAANPRYTGDVGMSMVPYRANVQDEQLGYLAMSNLDGIDNPTNVSGMGSIMDDAGTAMKYGGAGIGVGAAGLGLMGGAGILLFATVGAIQVIAARKSGEKLAEKLVE